MTTYISEPIAVDRASIKSDITDAMEAAIPGIDTSPGTTADFLADVFAQFHAEGLQMFTQQLAISFRYGAEKIDRIIQRTAVQATATATLVRVPSDTAERLVQAGTEFNLQGADGAPVAFQTVSDVTFAAADLSEPVELIAVLGGTGGNGLSTVLGPAQSVSWFSSLTLAGVTSGGGDAESDEDFLNRVADVKPLSAETIVRPDDLSRYLRNQTSVDRVLVLDLYNATTSTAGVGGHMTAIPIDSTGAALSGGTMTALETAAQALCVTGGLIHIIAPTYTDVDVIFAGVAEDGFDAADVRARAEAALLDFLNPARWGLPSSGDDRDWRETLTVRFQDIVTVLNNVQGFDHYAAPTGTATTTTSSPNLTLTTPTTGWVNGMKITGSGIPAATTIVSGAGTATMVMSANITGSGAAGVAITGTGLQVNGGVVDVTITGPGALPDFDSTAVGAVTAAP